MDTKHFEQIFSDAHVIDIDMSHWDKGIVLYVLADHAERVDGRKPLFAIEFTQVARLSMNFIHLNTKHLNPGEHFQWMIDDFSIETSSNGFDITLWGLASTPQLAVSCAEIRIRTVELTLLDEMFPGWDDPSQPFVRPSIEVLSYLLNRSKPSKKG